MRPLLLLLLALIIIAPGCERNDLFTLNKTIETPGGSSYLNMNLFVTDGIVRAMAAYGDTLYVGGDFTMVFANTGRGGIVNSTSGAMAARSHYIDGQVLVSISDGNGGWYIGGTFTKIGKDARTYLARINADGTLHSFNIPITGTSVNALAHYGDTLYVGGDFFNIGGQARNDLAAIDLSNGTVTGWDPNPAGGTIVKAIAVQSNGNLVYIGGNFTSVGVQPRNRVAAVDSVTAIATSFNMDISTGTMVNALVVSRNDSILYVGGNFTQIGVATQCLYLAQLDASSGALQDEGELDGEVNAIVTYGDRLYAGGAFQFYNAVDCKNTAAYDISALTLEPLYASGTSPQVHSSFNGTVYGLALSGDGSVLYAAGSFTGPGPYLAAVDPDVQDGSLAAWNPNPNGEARTVARSGSNLFAGGIFSGLNTMVRNRAAAFNLITGRPTNWNPDANSPVFDIAVSPDGLKIYLAGQFTELKITSIPVTRRRAAVVDPVNGTVDAIWNPDMLSNVNAIALSEDGATVYLGGIFTSVNIGSTNDTRNCAAAFNASAGSLLAWDPNVTGSATSILDLSVRGSTVYMVGEFTTVGVTARSNAAAVDGVTGIPTAWNPGPNSYTFAVECSDVQVMLGGNFTNLNSYLGAVDPTNGGLISGWNPAPVQAVNKLFLHGSVLYLGGQFNTVGGTPQPRAAAVNVSDGTLLPWNPVVDNAAGKRPYSILVFNDVVFLGGDFSLVNGVARPNLAAVDNTAGTLLEYK